MDKPSYYKNILKHLVCFEHQNHVMHLKFRFKHYLCGEEDRYATNLFQARPKIIKNKASILIV